MTPASKLSAAREGCTDRKKWMQIVSMRFENSIATSVYCDIVMIIDHYCLVVTWLHERYYITLSPRINVQDLGEGRMRTGLSGCTKHFNHLADFNLFNEKKVCIQVSVDWGRLCTVSNCDQWFLKQHEAERIEAMKMGNRLKDNWRWFLKHACNYLKHWLCKTQHTNAR